MKELLIKFASAICIMGVIFSFSGCQKDNTSSDVNTSYENQSEQTSSVLLPVEATFDEKYTRMLPSGEGEEMNIKGNLAITVTANSAKIYDPTSYESRELNTEYTLSNGVGVGDKCDDFINHFGIGRGYYVAVDSQGNAVDISKKSNKKFTFTAILKFDEAERKMSYFSASMIANHLEGMSNAGTQYITGADIGKDLLVVSLSVKGDLTVESFDIKHFIV